MILADKNIKVVSSKTRHDLQWLAANLHKTRGDTITSHQSHGAKLLKFSIFLSPASDGLIVPKAHFYLFWNRRYRIEMRLNSVSVRSQMISFFLGRNICYLCYHSWRLHPLICPPQPGQGSVSTRAQI